MNTFLKRLASVFDFPRSRSIRAVFENDTLGGEVITDLVGAFEVLGFPGGQAIGERGTDSEALLDHRAFTYIPERGLLAFPVELVTENPDDTSGWRSVGSVDHSEEQIWSVTESGFHLMGQIRHDQILETPISCTALWCPGDRGGVMRRALDIGGRLLTISNDGLVLHNFDNLTDDIGSLAFP